MGTESTIISIDCGTQSTRAVIWDIKGNMLAQAKEKHEILSPTPGWYEQDAESWWKATCLTIREVLKKVNPNSIEAMGIAHQRETFVPVSVDGTPLRNAIVHVDERPIKQVRSVKENVGAKKVHQITGKIPHNAPSFYKILWLKDEEPKIYASTHKYLDVQAYLLMHLIDDCITSYTSADSMGLIDVKSKTWASDLINLLGLEKQKFPDLCPPGKVVGNITKKASEETGLLEGLPVISGAGDGQCAALGTNTVEEGRAFLYLGTATVLGVYASNYIIDKGFRTLVGTVPNSYNLEGNFLGGYIVTWFIDNLLTDHTTSPGVAPEEILEIAASKIPAGSSGLITIPYWTKTLLAPYWDSFARGLTVGWSSYHTKAHFYRSILEGVAFENKLIMEKMTNVLDAKPKGLVLMGGGAKSSLWSQIISDIMGIPILVPQVTEATALGAAILAASGIDEYPSIKQASNAMVKIDEKCRPNKEKESFYNTLFKKVYRPFYPRVRSLIHNLSQIQEADI